ncbi:Rpn family recombination-promoting nuclease/putative transposase [Shouchella shacheensis]|uniref:Rpn family recombination-promoting nuclease/putative transposase n=1 Tax=Shouchella shacheensis TaxID=1649580 RepID=UPI00074000D0|nr:Rpn family recombination-promoting nuclease/putative transposase [Shouchella shacheensis]
MPIEEVQGLMDLKNDVAFKLMYAKEGRETFLIEMLNALLPEHLGYSKIKAIHFANNERIGKRPESKTTRLDVIVITDDGRRINVEMQIRAQPSMEKRTMYYWAEAFFSQLKQGEEYRHLNTTIAINFLYYNLDQANEQKYHHRFRLLEMETHKPLSDAMEIQYIELRKFSNVLAKQGNEIKSELELNLAPLVIQNMESLNEPLYLEYQAKGGEIMTEFLKQWKSISEDDRNWADYFGRKKEIYDEINRNAYEERQQKKMEEQQKKMEEQQREMEERQREMEEQQREKEEQDKKLEALQLGMLKMMLKAEPDQSDDDLIEALHTDRETLKKLKEKLD